MNTPKNLVLSMLAGIFLMLASPASAQFVALARKIKSMHTGTTDVATVLLDAKTANVYKAVTDTVGSTKKLTITKKDDKRRFIEFSNGKGTVSMQVDSLAPQLSQITVSAPHSDESDQKATDHAVNAIVGVCKKLGVKVTLPEK